MIPDHLKKTPSATKHAPWRGDPVWDYTRDPKTGQQPNGFIHRLFKDAGQELQIVVKYHDSKFSRHTFMTYAYATTFRGRWTGNTTGWMINAPFDDDDPDFVDE